MQEKIKKIVNEKRQLNENYVEQVFLEVLDLSKGKTYKELIMEINQCRYAHNDEVLDELISRITDYALSKVIQS